MIPGIHYGFAFQEKQDVKFFTIPSFEEAGGVVCAFSTRVGGVSSKPYDTLNFSRKREKSTLNFLENIKRFGNAVGFDFSKSVAINYSHSAMLYRAKRIDAGCGIIKDNVPIVCDGLYTDTQNLPLISYHADCVPLFFYDVKRRAVAICHAGWRGVISHITQNAIIALSMLGSAPGDILAAIGPCISVRHFEVGTDVSSLFVREFGDNTIEIRNSRIYANLAKACVLDMLSSGIKPANITVSDICTYENNKLLFSHRRDKGLTGAMAAVIKLQT
ncbi:MAG: peptidoglycan editing factor PgeF [Christensenellales bacterium]|jgi:YfiH family protein